MKSPKVANAVLCEDVRIEQSGKHILVGVYAENIIVSKLPATFPAMLWLQINQVTSQQELFEFRLAMSKNALLEGNFSVSTTESFGRATVSIGKFLIHIEEVGTLSADIRYEGGRWKQIFSIPVKLRDQGIPRALSYRRRRASDTWHWCRNCSNWPIADYEENRLRPLSGELCNECAAKQRAGSCQG